MKTSSALQYIMLTVNNILTLFLYSEAESCGWKTWNYLRSTKTTA